MSDIPVTLTLVGTIKSGDLPLNSPSSPSAPSAGGYSIRPKIYRPDRANPAFKAVGNALVLRAGVQIEFNGVLYAPAVDIPVALPTLLPGRDYAVRIKPGSTAADLSDLLQAYQYPDNSPAGSAIIGGFHFLPGDPATGLSTGGGWTPTLLAWSIWDTSFKPSCPDPRGMTRVANTGKWIDIYFQGTSSNDDGVSRNNDPILTGTNPPRIPVDFGGNGSTKFTTMNWWEANEHIRQWGKELPSYSLMCLAAFGTNEKDGRGVQPANTGLTSGYNGSSDPNFTSKWGLIQATGCMWIWCADMAYLPGPLSTSAWGFETYETGGRGKLIQKNDGATALLFGAQSIYRNSIGQNGTVDVAGSRCMETIEKLSDSSANIAIRGCADHLSL